MTGVKLTQLETSDDFEQALLYGVDKNGVSKAFKAVELAKLDLFAQAEQLEAVDGTDVYYNSPSKVKIPLGKCKIYHNHTYMQISSLMLTSDIITIDWHQQLQQYEEFGIAIPLPEGTKSCIMGVTHNNTKNIQNRYTEVHSDETFDSKNYDFMLLVHSKTYETAKRLSEKIKHDESEALGDGYNTPMYIKGHQLYHESRLLSGYITSSNYFYLDYNHTTKIIQGNMGEGNKITREAVFNVFPGYYLRWAEIVQYSYVLNDSRPYLVLHFQRNYFYTTDDSFMVKFNYDWLENMVIPNIVFDMYFKYEE